MPRQFFEDYVKPNYEAWRANQLDVRLAKNAVADANNMAARVFMHWEKNDPSKVYGVTSEGRYRAELTARECRDFGLVRDVAEAHKHVELDRAPRQVTRSEQTTVGGMGYGEGGWSEGTYGGGPQLVITLDNGRKRALSAVLKDVIEMWARLLAGWGL